MPRKKKQSDKKSDRKEQAKNNVKEFNESIAFKEMGINRELFREHIKLQTPTFLLKTLLLTNDKKKNDILVNTIKSEIKI